MFEEFATMSETELREAVVPWVDSLEELNEFIGVLEAREHDYGTCVYAMSLAAVASYNYMARKLGVTGFQASCADLDIIRRNRHMERFQLVDSAKLLYPQYKDYFDELSWDNMIKDNLDWLGKEAARLLLESPNANSEVTNHWKYLVALGEFRADTTEEE